MSRHIDAIINLIESVVVEQRYECVCGREFVLRPDTSRRAKVECSCGERIDFNLAH